MAAQAELVPDGFMTAEEIQQAEWEAQMPECPHCGAQGGEIYWFDYGVDRETGYRDAGERCTICSPRRPE